MSDNSTMGVKEFCHRCKSTQSIRENRTQVRRIRCGTLLGRKVKGQSSVPQAS